MRTLSHDFTFTLIPDVDTTRRAGYDQHARDHAMTMHAPILDGDDMIYAATSENRSSILVRRRVSDGTLIWCVNCGTFVPGECTPNSLVVNRGRIYTTSGDARLPNGPRLFCIDKYTGALLWTLSIDATTLDHARESTMQPVVVDRKRPLILVGVSSRQHEDVLKDDIGFPVYTDQGSLLAVEDRGISGHIVWRVPTCASPISVGETIRFDAPPRLNPFRPGIRRVVIAALAEPNMLMPHSVNGMTFIAAIESSKTTRQPIWRTPGIVITGADGILVGARHTGEKPFKRRLIVSRVPTMLINPNENNDGVLYAKELPSGYTVETESEAQGLGYWGNGVTGGPPAIVDNHVYFGTGQAHSLPLDDVLYTKGTNDVDSWRLTAERASEQCGLVDPECKERVEKFQRHWCDASIHYGNDTRQWSPRAVMSMTDALVCVRLDDGGFESITRTLPLDLYNQAPTSPVAAMAGLPVSTSGELVCGIFPFQRKGKRVVVAPTRSGTILFAGKKHTSMIVGGPPSMLGGGNLRSVADRHLYICQTNRSWIRRLRSPQPRYLLSSGVCPPYGNAVLQAIDPWKRRLVWERPLGVPGCCDLSMHKNALLIGAMGGIMVMVDTVSGEMIWQMNGKKYHMPKSSAAVANTSRVVWTPVKCPMEHLSESGKGIVCRQNPTIRIVSMQQLTAHLISHRYYRSDDGKELHTWTIVDGNLNLVMSRGGQTTVAEVSCFKHFSLILKKDHRSIIVANTTRYMLIDGDDRRWFS